MLREELDGPYRCNHSIKVRARSLGRHLTVIDAGNPPELTLVLREFAP
jgi:hypothetical protein